MQKRNIAKKGFVCMVERICEWYNNDKDKLLKLKIIGVHLPNFIMKMK